MEGMIEPSEFDLVVIGTGLTESIVAAAAAKAGHSVLQLDPSAHYGGAWASLRLEELQALLTSASSSGAAGNGPAPSGVPEAAAAAGVSGAEVWQRPGAELGPAGQYSLDLAPKVMFGAGPLIQLLLGSGAHHYLEFKLLQGSYLLDAGAGGRGQLRSVPSSRSEVFKDRQLSPLQKRALMRFLKAAVEALEGEGPLKDAFGPQPVADLLAQQGLDRQLQQSLLYGVLLADSGSGGGAASGGGGAGQQPPVAGAAAAPQAGQGMTAAEALERLRMYVESAGRYGPDAGPFLTPLYGCGELPQAFCRSAAVAGAVQVLRCGIEGLSFDEHTFCCDGVELATGQDIRCQQLAAGEPFLREWLATFQPASARRIVHRCCALLDGPPVPGEQQSMAVVLPGAGGGAGGPAAVRALALCSSTAVCPPGKHLLYLWAEGGAGSGSGSGSSGSQQPAAVAAAALLPALAALADTRGLQPPGGSSGSGSDSTSAQPASAIGAEAAAPGESGAGSGSGSGADSSLPAVLWAAFYTQTSTQLLPPGSDQPGGGGGSGGRWPANVALCPGPDGSATFVSAVANAKDAYWRLFPPAEAATAAADSDSAAGAAAAAAGEPGEGAAAAGAAAAGEAAAAPAPGAPPAAPAFPLDPGQRQRGEEGEEEGAAAAAAADGGADADSDDEALAALQAALQQVGGGASERQAQAAEEQEAPPNE